MTTRSHYRATSNNAQNPDQNVCAHAAAQFFHCENEVRFLHTNEDVYRAIRSKFSVRSVKSSVKPTVGASRAAFAKIAAEKKAVAFVVIVEGHVIVLNKNGETVVDTAPRKADRRKIRKAQRNAACFSAFWPSW